MSGLKLGLRCLNQDVTTVSMSLWEREVHPPLISTLQPPY